MKDELTFTTVGSKKYDMPKHIIIWMAFLIEIIPLYFMAVVSLKNNALFNNNPWMLDSISQWQWGNWVFGAKLMLPYLANTIFVTICSVIGQLVVAIMASYFFARYKMPLSSLLWSIFMFFMILPTIANIVPVFALLKSLNLLNSLWGLIVMSIAGHQIFNIFVLRHFIEDLPRDLFEAAEMDGASHFRQLKEIVIPMCAPIIGTLAVLSFLASWNDYMMPLVFLRDQELFTMGVGLIYLNSQYVKEWGHVMAAYLIASIPLIIIFLFSMKLFVRGLSAGSFR